MSNQAHSCTIAFPSIKLCIPVAEEKQVTGNLRPAQTKTLKVVLLLFFLQIVFNCNALL